MITAALAAAYQVTDYCVDVPDGGRLVLRIGERCVSFEAALKTVGERDWCIVSAANPLSMVLSDAENSVRLEQLGAAVLQGGWRCWRGVNLARRGVWLPEATLCVLGISRFDGLCLAEEFGQNALVGPDVQGVPALVWTRLAANA